MSLYFTGDETSKPTLPLNCIKWQCHLHEGFPYHYHKSLELLVICKGELQCMADDRQYSLKAGDALLFNPFTLHDGTAACDGTEYLCFTCVPELILNYQNSVLYSCADALDGGQCAFDEYYPGDKADTVRICEHVRQIHLCLNRSMPAYETRALTEAFGLLTLLFENHYSEVRTDSQHMRNFKFMRELSQYLSDHYTKEITTEDAAKALYLSTSRFSHLVQLHFGVSFSRYLCHYRIMTAIKKYRNTDMPVKEIAAAVGFNDYCYFSRVFKQYIGKSPALYFGRWKIER